MATQDITRYLHRPKQRYVGVRMQQGRTILDSDWNEDALLEAEDRRTALVELIGSHGSTNAGFQISAVTSIITSVTVTEAGVTSSAVPGYDFTIAPGSIFVGGMRFCLEQPETYRGQHDWLRIDELPASMPLPPTFAELKATAEEVRYDLVYLHAWQQPVSAVEDHEIRERALGGPDSSTRIRRMRRVEIATNVGSDVPADAFEAMFESLEDSGVATYDHATAELVSNAKLTVSFTAEPSTSACGSQIPPGYAGHEDQAIRVELFGERQLCWGFCNAAPLYRVRVNKDDPTRVKFISQPRDGERAPKIGQIVEIVPWSAKLPNDEKVAELQGVLARVTSSYNPNVREIVLDQAVPAEWLEWLETHAQHLSDRDGDNDRYLYLRVWDRGSDTESPALIDLHPDKPVVLAGTGLQVTLDPVGRSGDYWIIAARTATPTQPTPWDLLTGAAPHGTRHFYAPLAMIRWSLGANGIVATVHDVRRRIRRLGEGGCCTVTVSSTNGGHGLVDNFKDALAELPPAGGRICLLAGTHNFDLMGLVSNRNNVEIVGCGPQTVVTNLDEVDPGATIDTHGDPIITLSSCAEIRMRHFTVAGHARVGIKVESCHRVWIEHVEFTQTGSFDAVPDPDEYALPQSAIMALDVEELVIRRCTVEFVKIAAADVFSYAPAVVLGGQRIRLLDSRILAEEGAAMMGGVHVLSQSADVEIAGNIIRHGWGNGISIGHVAELNNASLPEGELTETTIWTAGERALGEVVTEQLGVAPHASMPTVDLVSEDHFWQPCGPVLDLRIHRNEISNMGLSGISSAAFDLRGFERAPLFLVAVELDVACNIIRDNARIASAIDAKFNESEFMYTRCLGGICLSGAISPHIRENHILRNHLYDPTELLDLPNVGIGIIAGQNVIIEDNRILDNGAHWTAGTHDGLRGGIAVEEVLPVVGYTFNDSYDGSYSVPRKEPDHRSDEAALTVRKNEVSQPSGKALWVRRAFGQVIVTDNVLHSYGDGAALAAAIDDAEFCIEDFEDDPLTRPARGACVEILGLALSREFGFDVTVPTSNLVHPSVSYTGGVVQFCGNTTLLDWTILNGHGASVVISSLDAAVVNNNVLTANMHCTASGLTPQQFLNNVIATPTPFSFLMYHCYVGATGSVQAFGNRFEEGVYDTVYSLVTAGALSEANMANDLKLQYANVLTMNVGTHCMLGIDPLSAGAEIGDNAAIFSIEPGSNCGSSFSVTFDPSGGAIHVCVHQLTPG